MLSLTRLFPTFLIGLAVFCGMLRIGHAAQFGNFTYTDSGTAITITDYPDMTSGSAVIPSMINGKPVRYIGDYAFRYCAVTAVTIPSGVLQIGAGAFRGCGALTSIAIPPTVTTIGSIAFENCTKLASVTMSEGLMNIGYYAFSNCAMTAVTVPASVISVTEGAFAAANLTGITVAAGNQAYSSLDGVLFDKGKTLVHTCPRGKTGTYAIPNGVTKIADGAFASCSKLTGVDIPSSVTVIGASAFHYCSGLSAVVIPSSVNSIGSGAFGGSGLVTVAIPSSLKSVGWSMFANCWKLKNVTIPSSVTSIEGNAFYDCRVLADISIPPSVTSIGKGAFSDCVKLAGIVIPANVSDIADEAFSYCGSLVSIAVDENNPFYSSIDGVLFDKTQTALLRCPGGRNGVYSIPYGTERIGYDSFGGCGKITSVNIPSTVTSIGDLAFSNCSFSSVRIPGSITSIESSAFGSCSNLAEAVFTGDAPAMEFGVFGSAAADFVVKYFGNHIGFSSPTWSGYPSIDLGAATSTPADINVQKPGGINLSDGGTCDGFGSVPIGSTSTVILTIENTGTADLTDLFISKGGANPGDFVIETMDSTYLVGGGSTQVRITFSPTVAGNRAASIEIASNDVDESPFVLLLSGSASPPLAPEIAVVQPVGSSLVDGTAKKSFGTVVVGKTGNAKTFTIKNTGSAKLTGIVVTKNGTNANDFSVIPPAKASLAAGESMTFKVSFKPTAKGTRNAAIHIKSNDGDENPFDIKLAGTGAKG